MFSILFLQRPLDEEGRLLWVDRFPFFEGAMGAPPNPLQDGENFFSDDVLADLLMIRFEPREILFIKKVAEGPMPNVMEESSEAEKFFNIKRRREVFSKNSGQGGIEPLRKDPGHMHRSERVLETGMFCGGINPTGTLELKDAPKPLNPECVNHISLGSLPFDAVGHHNIVINGICDQPSGLTLFFPFHCLRPVLCFIR
jgi:hypothetical protein